MWKMLTTIQEVLTNLGNAHNCNKCSTSLENVDSLTQAQQVLTSREKADTTTGRVNNHGECSQLSQLACMGRAHNCNMYIWRMFMHVLPHHDLTLYIVCNSMSHYGTDNRKAEPHAQRRSQHLINTRQK